MRSRRCTPEGFAPVEGGRLWHEVGGAGPPVVLIHAGRLTARAVIEGADHLPNMRRPEAFDRMVLEFLSQPEH